MAKKFKGDHVAVVGALTNATGLSRAAELVGLTLKDRGSRITFVDLTAVMGYEPTKQFDAITPAECDDSITDVVFVVGPDLRPQQFFDREWLYKRTVIAHWIWELDRIPDHWRVLSLDFNEVWACTDLLTDLFREALPVPCKTVPFAVHKDPFPPATFEAREAACKKFGVPLQCFVVGYSFAAQSNYDRKNPMDAWLAFHQAFPGNDNVRLVLRSHDLKSFRPGYDELRRLRDPRVLLFDGDRKIPLHDFYAMLNLYLTTSRAEGYGLNIAEAAQAGIPVVTGGWRLAPELAALPGVRTVGYQTELVRERQGHYSHITGARWSRPDLDEMARAMRRIQDPNRQLILDMRRCGL